LILEKIKELLIQKATKEHKKISPCLRHEDFSNSFTIFENKVIFWFNTEDGSTRALISEIEM
jgi:hypothetical protein